MNQKHLEVLKGGVTKWNNWREEPEQSAVLPDLRGINIAVHLARKDLSKANFRRVNFEGAHLEGAILCDVDLSYANLSQANLSGAKLQRAMLRETIFKETVLNCTKFHGATIWATTFIDVNLSTTVVKGLEQVKYYGILAIDFSTIYRSKGKIPEALLRAADIPESFMQYIRDLGKKPFNYYSCFISYSSKDQRFAEHLYKKLREKGVHCWLAPADLKSGDPFPQYIADAIHHHDKLIVILSTNSIESDWVSHEVEIARKKGRNVKNVLFPIRLDDAYSTSNKASKVKWLNEIKHTVHIGDFRNWTTSGHCEPEFEKLLKALEKDEV